MIKIGVMALALAVLAFLAYVAIRPAEFQIRRTQVMKASPEAVFALIDSLSNFNRWNPFVQDDPALKIEYSGPPSGKGAAYAWHGSGKTGRGRMEITESVPFSQVAMKLDFTEPFEAHNHVVFLIAPEGSATKVTWTMSGRNPFLHKVMATIFNMDKMVGGEFDKGLSNLKNLAERPG